MRYISGLCLLMGITLASAAPAAPGDTAPVASPYGQKLTVQNRDDLLPTFKLLGRAREVAEAKGGAMDKPIFVLLATADYATFAGDPDMGPFVQAARGRGADAVVFVMEAAGQMKHVVFFTGEYPTFYASAGKRAVVATADDVAKSLEPVPHEAPHPAENNGSPYKFSVQWRPMTIHGNNGNELTAYQIMSEGKPELQPAP